MGQLRVEWTKPVAHGARDLGADRPHLWVFGVVVDAATVGTGCHVLRRRPPSGIDLDAPITPISGLVAAGVVVVAWASAGAGDASAAVAYDAAADALDVLVGQQVAAADLARPGGGAMRDLRLRIEQDVTDTVRGGWTPFARMPGRPLGTAHCLLTLDGPVDHGWTCGSRRGPGDPRLRGTLRYSVTPR